MAARLKTFSGSVKVVFAAELSIDKTVRTAGDSQDESESFAETVAQIWSLGNTGNGKVNEIFRDRLSLANNSDTPIDLLSATNNDVFGKPLDIDTDAKAVVAGIFVHVLPVSVGKVLVGIIPGSLDFFGMLDGGSAIAAAPDGAGPVLQPGGMFLWTPGTHATVLDLGVTGGQLSLNVRGGAATVDVTALMRFGP